MSRTETIALKSESAHDRYMRNSNIEKEEEAARQAAKHAQNMYDYEWGQEDRCFVTLAKLHAEVARLEKIYIALKDERSATQRK